MPGGLRLGLYANSHGLSKMAALPRVSRRMEATDPSPIYKVLAEVGASKQDVLSLAQGVTHWSPPEACMEAVKHVAFERATSCYGPVEGLPALREALEHTLEAHNGLPGHQVMVTAGANQAFMNVVLSLLDAGDEVVLFRPYYFNHHMAIQMTGFADSVLYGPCSELDFHPDLDWLERALAAPGRRVKLVVLVNPCNPTGVVLGREELERCAALCAAAGAWLVLDETYEGFTFDVPFATVGAPHVIHLGSFSKSYGLAGWRVGFIAHAGGPTLWSALLKAQDTIPISAAQCSQHLALAALREAGPAWVERRVRDLRPARDAVGEELRAALSERSVHGEGGIYFWARLPEGAPPDEQVMQWLVRRHGVAVVHGSSCGAPGYIRVSFANTPADRIRAAAHRLRGALEDMKSRIQSGRDLWDADGQAA